eukprot:3406948-Amphidinium_carterae.1
MASHGIAMPWQTGPFALIFGSSVMPAPNFDLDKAISFNQVQPAVRPLLAVPEPLAAPEPQPPLHGRRLFRSGVLRYLTFRLVPIWAARFVACWRCERALGAAVS